MKRVVILIFLFLPFFLSDGSGCLPRTVESERKQAKGKINQMIRLEEEGERPLKNILSGDLSSIMMVTDLYEIGKMKSPY